jgi:hypothetical protein
VVSVRNRVLLLTLVAVALVGAACDSGGSGEASSTSAAASTTVTSTTVTSTTGSSSTTVPLALACPTLDLEAAVAEGTGAILEWLALVPDTESNRAYLTIQDFAYGRERLGIGPYSGEFDAESVDAYLQAVYSDQVLFTWYLYHPRVIAETEAWRAEWGFTMFEVTHEVIAGEAPRYIRLLGVPGMADAIDQAVRSDPVWSEYLTATENAGVTVYDWGDYETHLELSTTLRPLGEAGQLAVADDVVVRTDGFGELDPVLGVLEGTYPSLADDAQYEDVAQMLERLGAAAVFVSADVVEQGNLSTIAPGLLDRDEMIAWFFEDNPLLAPYEVVGIGGVPHLDGITAIVVLEHDSEELAVENAERFCQEVLTGWPRMGPVPTWQEQLGVPEIAAEGTLMIARFPSGPDGPSWFVLSSNLLSGETLFWIGDS